MATKKAAKPKTATPAQIERVAEVLYDLIGSSICNNQSDGPYIKPKDARELAERLIEALK